MELQEQVQKLKDELVTTRLRQDEFIQIAAHDLLAPLRKLSSFTDLLFNKFPELINQDAFGYKERIQSCVQQMQQKINKLAILAEVSNSEISFQPCNLSTIVNNVLNELDNLINETKAIITFDQLPIVEGIPSQMHELFKNLIENGITFNNRKKGILLSIHYSLTENQERFLQSNPNVGMYHKIEITDNGIGVDQNNLEKIFQPFIRLHGKSEYPGHGLGLAICKRIVENHRGILYAESETEGSRFIMLFPVIANR